MPTTWKYVSSMAKMVQVRNVPDALHRALKARAALSGMSLSDYILAELRRIAERPSRQELLERLRSRQAVEDLRPPAAEVVAAEREGR